MQFQSMLWRLLGHALDLSNPESDTLVEEALRLLVSALNCSTAFVPAFQVPLFRAALPCTSRSAFFMFGAAAACCQHMGHHFKSFQECATLPWNTSFQVSDSLSKSGAAVHWSCHRHRKPCIMTGSSLDLLQW